LSGLWALEWAWHVAETNLRCVRSSGVCTPNLNSLALIVSEISAFIRTDGQTDMARSTRLVILIKNIYILYGVGNAMNLQQRNKTANQYTQEVGQMTKSLEGAYITDGLSLELARS